MGRHVERSRVCSASLRCASRRAAPGTRAIDTLHRVRGTYLAVTRR